MRNSQQFGGTGSTQGWYSLSNTDANLKADHGDAHNNNKTLPSRTRRHHDRPT
jgi:hypothetical protein